MNLDNLEKNVAYDIRRFPSKNLLQCAQTEDQRKYWDNLATFYLWVSQCWLDDLEGKDILIERVKNKELDRWYYKALMTRVSLLQSLWKLINGGYQEIYAALVKQNYQHLDYLSIPMLFLKIVQTDADNTFKICLKPYHNVSNQARVKAWKVFSNYYSTGKIEPEELNVIKSAGSQYAQNSWLLFCVQAIVRATDSGNKKLLYKLKIFEEALIEDMKLSATGLSRKHSSPTFEKFYCFTWHQGRIVRANKTGSYPFNKT